MTVDTYLNGPYVQVAAVRLAWPERAMSDVLRMSAPAIWMLETAYVLKNHPCREAGVETSESAQLWEKRCMGRQPVSATSRALGMSV